MCSRCCQPWPGTRGLAAAEEGSGGPQGQLAVSATSPVFGSRPHADLLCLPSTSCPEDCGHKEEAAAVHRALQVAAQLPKPLVCLFRTGVRRAHKPGTLGGGGGGVAGKSEPRGAWRSLERSQPVLRWISFFLFFLSFSTS